MREELPSLHSDPRYWNGPICFHADSSFAKIVAIDVPKNCIKYAEKSLIDGCVQAGLGTPKILPNLSFHVGKNLSKLEHKEPGSRLRAVADAYAKTFA